MYGRTLKPSAVRAFSKRLNAFYGFPIELNMGGGFHTKKAAEVALAIKKGVPTGFDVFWTSYSTSVRLERSGAVQKVDWVKELGHPRPRCGPANTGSSRTMSACALLPTTPTW